MRLLSSIEKLEYCLLPLQVLFPGPGGLRPVGPCTNGGSSMEFQLENQKGVRYRYVVMPLRL
jgi:hypothetical protein